ncbi:hypothetical protein LCGC14_0481480 [marine sediment metagenome]|uniref:Heme exporter protein D n=1 Tax=marine sediment metagenome TaxID=412755 RepID=A0A0F9VHZ0_9ZZZZ
MSVSLWFVLGYGVLAGLPLLVVWIRVTRAIKKAEAETAEG